MGRKRDIHGKTLCCSEYGKKKGYTWKDTSCSKENHTFYKEVNKCMPKCNLYKVDTGCTSKAYCSWNPNSTTEFKCNDKV